MSAASVSPSSSPRSSQTIVLALTPVEAAAALSMSRDSFDRYVRDELRLVRVGRKVLVPVRELERWVDRNAAVSIAEEVGR